jgi:excinuclease ABC subunit A
MDCIVIRGASQHNLKNVTVSLPRNRFIVITGVSGSGKSTLAFDTIFAEGQRRYLEALSTRTRQFLQRLDAPKVDAVEGLSPAIAVQQATLTRNPRSTVGTLTEIHDFLRLLYAHLGTFHCPTCGSPVRAYTIPQMVYEITELWPADSRLLILGPLGILRERELPGALSKFRRDGFARVRLEERIYELDPPPFIPRRNHYRAEIVVDRLVLGPDKEKRLADALELAARIGRGLVGVANVAGEEKLFSEAFNCLSCGRQMPEPSPSLFSFNHPLGACPSCKGLGYPGHGSGKPFPLAADAAVDKALSPGAESASCWPSPRHFTGTEPSLCPHCEGSRLNEIARSVRLAGMPVQELCRLPITALGQWFRDLSLTPAQSRIAEGPITEVLHRLRSLEELGLAYLTLERSAATLSGGEMQRLRLAQQISTPLSGVLYVLDEPSIGLHPRDQQRLLHILHQLRDKGNTLIVVEHDRETIMQADFVVDMGPGAGVQGGEVIFAGLPEGLIRHPTSLTGSYLSGRKSIPVPKRRPLFTQGAITLVGASGHNLKGINVSFPLGCVTCVTGVSGSGKTTLVMHTLYHTLIQHLYRSNIRPAPLDRLENAEAFRKVILVDQTPLGRSSHSTPATYSGVFSAIRELFAQLPEARARGYGSRRFSFNTKGGRCESCRGEGTKKIDMLFLPDISVTCPDCEGRRYNRETLQIKFKGHSVADILEMTVTETSGLLGNIPAIARKLGVLIEVGLGYLRLGQTATTLSGGEAQRVKLALELSRQNPDSTLYILDEPTTGLHFDDIQKLLHVLQRLVDQGHTVIMIEHHPDVVKTVDYVVDLGPEGGDQGGYLLAAGTPEEIARMEASHTGRFLKQIFKQAEIVV